VRGGTANQQETSPNQLEGEMKTRLWNEMLMVAVALLALNGVARAQSTDNDGCSNATLRGDYILRGRIVDKKSSTIAALR
jgi:hypothetical protein